MKKRERKALCAYLRFVANEMELRDWTFNVQYRCDSEDAYATVHPIDGRKRATIKFEEDFRRSDFESHLGSPADSLMFRAASRNLEYGVDGLAHAIAKHLPLIEWPTKGR